MSCSICAGGQNQILALNVPGSDRSDGTPTDVSGLVADKTVEISGTYVGQYVILGSHDGSNYVPLLTFNSGAGVQSVRQTTCVTLKFMKVRRRAQNPSGIIGVNIGSAVTCNCENGDSPSEIAAMELAFARTELERETQAHVITKGLSEALAKSLEDMVPMSMLLEMMGSIRSEHVTQFNRVVDGISVLDRKMLAKEKEAPVITKELNEALASAMAKSVSIEMLDEERLHRADIVDRLVKAITVLDQKVAALEKRDDTSPAAEEMVEIIAALSRAKDSREIVVDDQADEIWPGIRGWASQYVADVKFVVGIAIGAIGGAAAFVLSR